MVKKAETKPLQKKKKELEDEAEIEFIVEKKKIPKQGQNIIKSLKDKLKKRESEVRFLKKENARLREENLRKVADMENLRKRLAREKTEFYQYALSEFLKELFTVLDNFERALEATDQASSKSFREGIEMIYKQYQDLLKKQGVEPVETEDKKFDPRLHQAFITEESEDVEEPEVTEELQKGYTLHDRLLRPALVKVVVPKKDNK
ncbi:MAG: nucleotide exchange factor GrpE [Candidatus Aminicenantes bacterium]|nr:nucleotide exchange factor GrpE [Candidatus Aminicenantes bacterium]